MPNTGYGEDSAHSGGRNTGHSLLVQIRATDVPNAKGNAQETSVAGYM